MAAWAVTLGTMIILAGQKHHLSVTWRAVMIFPGGHILIGSTFVLGGVLLLAALRVDRRHPAPKCLVLAAILPAVTCGWITASQFNSALQSQDAVTFGPMGWGLVALVYSVRVINLLPEMGLKQL